MMKKISCVFNDTNTQMNIENLNGRGYKDFVVLPHVGHLRYENFKRNCNIFNFLNQSIDALSNNIENNYLPV